MEIEEEKQDMSEEESGVEVLSVEELQTAGINASDIKKLQDAGIITVMGILMYPRKSLMDIKGLSEAKVTKILESALKLCPHSGFISGTDALEKRKLVLKITTGSKALDQLLGGGIETSSITEVVGEFRTGKTQLCHTLCVTTQLPVENGGGSGKVAFIDTEGTFRPERIAKIAERFDLDAESVLDNILYARVYTHDNQIEILTPLAAKLLEEPFRLIIVDSSTALFRVDFVGRGELASRQNYLGQFLSKLVKLAEQFNVAVVISNQVVSDPGAGSVFVSDPKKPIGGNIMAHACTTRLFLRKGRGEQRICKLYDSPSLPESDCIYSLTDGGVADNAD